MKFLDKLALNRLIAIITSFILSVLKIFAPNNPSNVDNERKSRPIRKKIKDLIDKVT
jgi:hypothetical protein